MEEDFNWEQLAWTSPIIVAVMTGLFLLLKAFADKRVDPLDRMEKVLNTYESSLEDALASLGRSREREKKAFKGYLEHRDWGLAWEDYEASGFADPPGRPKRPESVELNTGPVEVV
ncbi:hypothetical protein AUR04nite_00620 [Glutamicibacter uratoxydans]|uniref:Uncharacterized protein n=1 Tax=Glutamicibacter uratoxydans TaxID=43667 RepID=A0A4Y4DLM4_GLUUR|nr:hypothetical protein [Glutamicibacter uratoxydans]GED04530.1 hypothetical protein AUR04nite_00620 [Glutamicibacter uratoxydans]